MGYYTRYELSQEKNQIPWEVFEAYINAHKDDMYGVESDGSSADSCKWYEHDDSVKAMSKEFPNTVFKLYGEGEESGDIWAKWYHNGKVLHTGKAKIVIDEPDLSKVKVVAYVPKVAPVKVHELEEPKGRKFKKGI